MKKVLIATLMVSSAFGVFAQADVVKDAGNAMKKTSPDYQAILQQLQPALTNPETATDAATWVTAGKAAIGLYDNLYKMQAIGQEVDVPLMGNALMDGIEYYITALPFDSVPDEKGKIKTKYSKDIIKQVKENYNVLNPLAATLYNAQDFNGAYRAWDMYLTIPQNPVLGKNAPKAEPDSIMCDIAFNKGIAAWQGDSLANALAAFRQAILLGYDKKQVYDYSINLASQLGDKEAVLELAQQAYPLYGDEEPNYLQIMINDKIDRKQFDEAKQMITDAIASSPDNGYLYFSAAVLDENLDDIEGAIDNYKKSAAMVPTNAPINFNAGRILLLKAQRIDENTTIDNYETVKENEIVPLYREAAEYLEAAYDIDPDNMHQAASLLKSVYYYLNDGDNYKRFENL